MDCDRCDVEPSCGYLYKPCECVGYRKYREKTPEQIAQDQASKEKALATRPSAVIIPFPTKIHHYRKGQTHE